MNGPGVFIAAKMACWFADETCGVGGGSEVTAGDDETASLVFDDGIDLRLPVADAFVLHEDGPAQFGAVFNPAGVLDSFVLRNAIMFGQGDQVPLRCAEQSRDGDPAEAAVDEEPMRLFGWRHAGRPRSRRG